VEAAAARKRQNEEDEDEDEKSLKKDPIFAEGSGG
jgi:hypothetical protein